MISVTLTSSAPGTAWVSSLWSTRTRRVGTGLRRSLLVRMPSNVPSSLVTIMALGPPAENFRRTSVIRLSGLRVANSRSASCSMVEAVRTNQAVVAVSCGLTRMLTRRASARATIEGSTGRLPLMMMARIPNSMARCWTSRRSPTMMMERPAGMLSFSEIFQNVPTSIAPMRTNSSSSRSPSTRWSTEAPRHWTMRARLVRTWRSARGSWSRGMKKWPSWVRAMVPVARFS